MKRILSLVVVVMLAVTVFLGYNEVEAKKAKQPTVIFVNVGSNIPYPAATQNVFLELTKARGWKGIVLDGQLDATRNVRNLEQAAAMKPDAVICMLMDATVQSNAIRKVYRAGIPLVLDTGRPNPEDRKFANCYTGVDDITAGRRAAELIHEGLNGKGNIVIIQGIAGQQTVIDRNIGFNERLKELNSEVNILAENFGDWSKVTATKIMEDFLTRYGEKIDGVFAICDETAAGAALAISEAGIPKGKIKIVGVGGSKTGLAGVASGDVYGTTYQSPRATMIKSIEAVQYIIDNKVKAGQSLDPYFRYIDLPKVTAENIDEFLPGEW